MTITNFGTLKSTIADFLNRDDLASVVPAFVQLAEAQFRGDIRDYRQITKAAITLNAQYVNLPADWLETIRVKTDNRVVQQISLDDMADRRTQADDATGEVVYFAHLGSQIELYPTPGSSETGEITYFATITALSADGDTNWLLTAAPDVYLYGSLMQSAPYLKDDARVAVWGGLYAEAVARLERENAKARFGGPLRMKLRTYG
jgi:hypothetical protein